MTGEVQTTAAHLAQLLHPEDDWQAIEEKLWRFAQERGLVRASRGVSSRKHGGGVVYLGPAVVVKANFVLAPDTYIPQEYRPEQVVVWEDPDFGPWEEPRRVVVQPRYRNVDDVSPFDHAARRAMEDDFQELQFIVESEHPIDAHIGNWGLREDGSPVLFDW